MIEAAIRLEGVNFEQSFERNVLIEVVLLHARNLIEFLSEGKKDRKEMSPDDFASGWDYDLGRELLEELGAINENLSHISWKRVSGKSRSVSDDIIDKVLDVAHQFKLHLAKSGLLGDQLIGEALDSRPNRPLVLGLVNGTD
jgi:hypothetical protein